MKSRQRSIKHSFYDDFFLCNLNLIASVPLSNKTQKPMGNAVKSPTKSLKSPGSAQAGTRCKATDLQEHVTKETTKPIAKNTSKLLSPATDSTLPISVGKQCNKSVTFVKEHIECVCCSDDRRCILKFPCGHLYCKICIGTLFKMALKDRSLIPVRCCDTPIDQSLTHLVLNDEDQRAYAEALEEVQAKRKMYCPNRQCASFINLDKMRNSFMLNFPCPRCNLMICSACLASHPNITCMQYQALPVFDRSLDDQAFLRLAKNQRYARCGNCQHYVERTTGCNNIHCRCGHQFCYACHAPTNSCICGSNQHAPIYRHAGHYQPVYGYQAPAHAPVHPPQAPPQSIPLPPAPVPVLVAGNPPVSGALEGKQGGDPLQGHRKNEAHRIDGTDEKATTPCKTHQWRRVNSTMEVRRCDNCLEKKNCFQNKCDICGLRVCSTCRYRRI